MKTTLNQLKVKRGSIQDEMKAALAADPPDMKQYHKLNVELIKIERKIRRKKNDLAIHITKSNVAAARRGVQKRSQRFTGQTGGDGKRNP